MANDSSDEKIKGISVKTWAWLVNTVGISGLIVGVILWLVYVNVPRVIDAHMRLLERTGDTLESMDATLRQSNKILTEVNTVEKQTKVFMQQVCDDHKKMEDSLDCCKETVDVNGKKLDAVIEAVKKP